MEIFNFDQRPIDVFEIAELFEVAFKRKFDMEYWNWRFLKNPNFDKVYITYAKEGDKLIAYYAVSPIKFLVNGKNENFALSMMTMTHPDFGGRGLFKTLAQRIYTILNEDGFAGVIGFANINSHYGFRKYLNWIDINIMTGLSLENKSENDLDYTFQKISPSTFNSIGTKTSQQNIHAVKNSAFLSWRFFENPENEYFEYTSKAGTVFIFKIYNKREIDIVDYYSSGNFLTDLQEFILNYSGFRFNVWTNIHNEEHLVFEKMKFLPQGFSSYFGLIPFKEHPNLLDYKNWDIKMVESDIF